MPPALAASEVLDFEPGPSSGGEGYASCEEFADHDFLKAKRQNQLGPEIDVPPQYGHCSEGMIERYANKTHVTYHRNLPAMPAVQGQAGVVQCDNRSVPNIDITSFCIISLTQA